MPKLLPAERIFWLINRVKPEKTNNETLSAKKGERTKTTYPISFRLLQFYIGTSAAYLDFRDIKFSHKN